MDGQDFTIYAVPWDATLQEEVSGLGGTGLWAGYGQTMDQVWDCADTQPGPLDLSSVLGILEMGDTDGFSSLSSPERSKRVRELSVAWEEDKDVNAHSGVSTVSVLSEDKEQLLSRQETTGGLSLPQQSASVELTDALCPQGTLGGLADPEGNLMAQVQVQQQPESKLKGNAGGAAAVHAAGTVPGTGVTALNRSGILKEDPGRRLGSLHSPLIQGSGGQDSPTPLAMRLAGVLRDIKTKRSSNEGTSREDSGTCSFSNPRAAFVRTSDSGHGWNRLLLTEEKTSAESRQRRKVELSVDWEDDTQCDSGSVGFSVEEYQCNLGSRHHALDGSESCAGVEPKELAHSPFRSWDSFCGRSAAGLGIGNRRLCSRTSSVGSEELSCGAGFRDYIRCPIPCSPLQTERARGTYSSPPSALVVLSTPSILPDKVGPTARKYTEPQFCTQATRQLLRLATAYSTGNLEKARQWVRRLKQDASPTGLAVQRLMHYMIQGLVSRFEEGRFSPVAFLEQVIAHKNDCASVLESAQKSINVMYGRSSERFMAHALKHALCGHSRVHVVVMTCCLCPDWNDLFHYLVDRCASPTELHVRVTILVSSVEVEHAPEVQGEFAQLATEVAQAAQRHGLKVQCRLLVVSPKELHANLIQVHPGEALAVASWTVLQNTVDGSVLRHNPRDALLKGLWSLRPRVVAVVEVDGNFNSPFFLARFSESLRMALSALQWLDHMFYSAKGSLLSGAVVPSIYELKIAVDFMNCIASEGLARFQRAESIGVWRDRFLRLGFREKPLDETAFELLRSEVVHRGLLVQDVDGCASLRREDSPLLFLGTWY